MNLREIEELYDNGYVLIDKSYLPTKSLFYDDGFDIFISKISKKDIFDIYRAYSYDTGNVDGNRIYKNMMIFSVFKKYLKFTKKFSYKHIKLYDMLYIFLVLLDYSLDGNAILLYDVSEFESKFEPLYDLSLCLPPLDKYMTFFDKKKKSFIIDGYKYCPISIGVYKSNINILFKNDFIEPASTLIFQNFLKYNKTNLKEKDLLIFMNIYDGFPQDEIIKMNNIINTFTLFGRGLLLGKDETFVLNYNIITIILRNYYKFIPEIVNI